MKIVPPAGLHRYTSGGTMSTAKLPVNCSVQVDFCAFFVGRAVDSQGGPRLTTFLQEGVLDLCLYFINYAPYENSFTIPM